MCSLVSFLLQGWGEGLQLMQEGAKWEFYIPHHLAYGDHGLGHFRLIHPKAVLVYRCELLEVLQNDEL